MVCIGLFFSLLMFSQRRVHVHGMHFERHGYNRGYTRRPVEDWRRTKLVEGLDLDFYRWRTHAWNLRQKHNHTHSQPLKLGRRTCGFAVLCRPMDPLFYIVLEGYAEVKTTSLRRPGRTRLFLVVLCKVHTGRRSTVGALKSRKSCRRIGLLRSYYRRLSSEGSTSVVVTNDVEPLVCAKHSIQERLKDIAVCSSGRIRSLQLEFKWT
jgi:hypothetical protein